MRFTWACVSSSATCSTCTCAEPAPAAHAWLPCVAPRHRMPKSYIVGRKTQIGPLILTLLHLCPCCTKVSLPVPRRPTHPPTTARACPAVDSMTPACTQTLTLAPPCLLRMPWWGPCILHMALLAKQQACCSRLVRRHTCTCMPRAVKRLLPYGSRPCPVASLRRQRTWRCSLSQQAVPLPRLPTTHSRSPGRRGRSQAAAAAAQLGVPWKAAMGRRAVAGEAAGCRASCVLSSASAQRISAQPSRQPPRGSARGVPQGKVRSVARARARGVRGCPPASQASLLSSRA